MLDLERPDTTGIKRGSGIMEHFRLKWNSVKRVLLCIVLTLGTLTVFALWEGSGSVRAQEVTSGETTLLADATTSGTCGGAKVFVEVLNFCSQSLPIISIFPREVPGEAFNIDRRCAINCLFFFCFATFSIVVSQRLKMPVIQ